MPCGCSDKNINKKLNLEYMKTMSIDNIINLYKDGYILEGLEHNDEYREIVSMAYGDQCSGDPQVAINNTGTITVPNLITKGSCFAQRFLSNLRCLDMIQFWMERLNNVNFTIEIREDQGGLPKGAPGTSTGRIIEIAGLSYNDIPTTANWVIESIGAIINSGSYYWVVFKPSDFTDSQNYRTGEANYRFRIYDGQRVSGYDESFYYGGAWQGPYTSFTTAFALYKKPNFAEACTSITAPIASPSTLTVGGSLTLSSTVSPTASFTVEFVDQNNVVRATTTSSPSTGIATTTWNTSGATPGTYNISARVGTQCSSGTTPVTINAIACISITTPTASPSTVTVGGSVTLSSTTSPTGTSFTVEFVDQNNTVRATAASSSADGSVVAIWNTSGVTPGAYNIKARVGTQCTSGTTPVTINAVVVTCTSISNVTATPTTITLGNSTTLQATVTPSSPGALTIEFIDSDTNTLLGTGTSCSTTSINNTCSVPWTPSVTRTYNIKARVGTQCTSAISTSVTVNPSSATCLSISNVVASKSTTLVNNPVTLTATITPSVPGALTIEFVNMNTNIVLGTCNTTSINNTCSVIWMPTTAGTYNIKARSGTCTSPSATTVIATQVVEAGTSGAGMLLIGGLAIGALYFATMRPPSPPKIPK